MWNSNRVVHKIKEGKSSSSKESVDFVYKTSKLTYAFLAEITDLEIYLYSVDVLYNKYHIVVHFGKKHN